jgi:hypothetical protein
MNSFFSVQVFLFHGTGLPDALQNGLDPRVSLSNNLFGHGIYLYHHEANLQGQRIFQRLMSMLFLMNMDFAQLS